MRFVQNNNIFILVNANGKNYLNSIFSFKDVPRENDFLMIFLKLAEKV